MHPTTTTATNRSGSVGGLRRRPLARVASALTAVAVVVTAALSLTAAPALADDCPNAALRAENNSTQLPDCRAYEQVSPEFKEGFATVPEAFTDDGRLAFKSTGNFANNGYGYGSGAGGNAYMATRSASGWSITALAPSGPEFAPAASTTAAYSGSSVQSALSSDLRSTLWKMRRANQPDTVRDLYVRTPEGAFTPIGSVSDESTYDNSGDPTVVASNDLSHVTYLAQDGQTYEYASGGPRRPVGVDNAGQPLFSSRCGDFTVGTNRSGGAAYHAMSDDGRVIFLTCRTPVHGDPEAVYARVNGTTTIDVSASQCTRTPSDPGGVCGDNAPAIFKGADGAGTTVFFTTTQQLVNGDTDSTTDLYECDIPAGLAPIGAINPCPHLREISGAVSGANVNDVNLVSDDGSRVYFTATGVLASNLDADGAPAAAGDRNLYVWTRDASHPVGEMRFVGKLDPADQAGPAQATDDGRFLVLTTHSPLIDHGPQADTDTAQDTYRYDAQTGALTRLSTDVDGHGGNDPGMDAYIINVPHSPAQSNRLSARRGAMSDDGSSVVFMTPESLAPDDTNGTVDTYLWHDGSVSLISSGRPTDDQGIAPPINGAPFSAGSYAAMISPSGRDVFFTTTAQLVPSDVDTVIDTYDARVGGGFDLSTPPTCAGDGCQSPPSAPPPASLSGSTSSTGQASPPQTTPAFTVGKLTASQLKRVVSTGKVSLSITTNAPGRLSAQATAPLAQRVSTVGSARLAVAKAGTVSLPLTLSKRARAELKRARKLTVKVLIRQDNVAIARTVSLRLTQPKAAKKQTKKKSSRATSRHAAAKGGRS